MISTGSWNDAIFSYGLGQGLDAVPAIAQRLGMRVKLGVWLTRDTAHNWRELERGLALARQFKGTVDLLIVGNEVLLRRELLPAELAGYLDHARRHAPVPVSYADVWEFWLRHAALAAHVDLVTAHILPYWEDDPVAVGDAVAHVHAVAARMRQGFANQPIWIGETGWPAAGRQRAGAVPGRIEQARFVRELLHSTAGAPLDYNLIEGFDQPWKRAFEGAMGGYWGLFDQFGQPRVALVGPVVEDLRWWRGPLGAGLGALCGAVLAVVLGAALAPLILAGALLGASMPAQWLASQHWDRTPWEWGTSLLLGVAAAALTVVAALHLTNSPRAAPHAPHAQRQLDRVGSLLRLLVLFCAASVVLTLLFDARYRPFPWWWFAAPAASLVTWRAGGVGWQQPCSEERLLAGILAAGALVVAALEGWRNTQALAFCLLMVVLAASFAPGFRTKASSASKAAGAHKPVV